MHSQTHEQNHEKPWRHAQLQRPRSRTPLVLRAHPRPHGALTPKPSSFVEPLRRAAWLDGQLRHNVARTTPECHVVPVPVSDLSGHERSTTAELVPPNKAVPRYAAEQRHSNLAPAPTPFDRREDGAPTDAAGTNTSAITSIRLQYLLGAVAAHLFAPDMTDARQIGTVIPWSYWRRLSHSGTGRPAGTGTS